MNKKLMALAVAGALAAPAAAFAQASNVQLYGRANLGFDQYQATGAAAGSAFDFKSRSRIYDSGSRLGVRGTEDLGGGLKAMFVIESGANIDTGTANGQSGSPNTSTGTLASRDSYVGLGGTWGDVRFGRQSIFWVNGVIAQSGPNYINTDIPWYNGAGMGRVAGPTARTSNVVSYNSPTWTGFNFTVSYSPNSEAAVAGADTNASIWGVTLRYNGPIHAQWDYAVNQAATGGTTRRKITGNKIGIGWSYAPGALISVTWVQDKNDDNSAISGFSAAGDDIKQSHWGLNWEHTFGNVQLLAMYSKLQKASGCTESGTTTCANTDATGYMVGARYLFSKRTAIYASWNEVRNGSNQVADYAAAGYSSATGGTLAATSAGADPRILAIGVMHNF